MAGDNPLRVIINSEELAYPLRYIAVARSVETVTAHAVLLIQVVRYGVEIRVCGHRLVEGCVEHAHLRQTRHQFADSLYTFKVGRIVKRSKVYASLESLEHLVVKHNALVELLASVYHAVANGVNLVKTLDDSYLRVGQQREDELHTLCVLGYVVHHFLLCAVGHLHFNKRFVKAYALCAARRHDRLVVHVVKCILDRRAAAIQY